MALINLDKHQKEHALLQLLQPEQTGANLAAELAAIGVYSAPTAAPMGAQGAGMGVCNPAYVPAGLVGLSGYTDKMHANFGNYIHPASGCCRSGCGCAASCGGTQAVVSVVPQIIYLVA